MDEKSGVLAHGLERMGRMEGLLDVKVEYPGCEGRGNVMRKMSRQGAIPEDARRRPFGVKGGQG
jgi:hypothetical protein